MQWKFMNSIIFQIIWQSKSDWISNRILFIFYVYSFFVFFIGLALFCSTFYDYLSRKLTWKSWKSLTSFSLLRNASNLFQINKSASVINCIDSIKVISAIWIVCGHRQERLKKNYTNSFVEKVILGSVHPFTEAVVTFLVCSAVLVTQSLIKAFER